MVSSLHPLDQSGLAHLFNAGKQGQLLVDKLERIAQHHNDAAIAAVGVAFQTKASVGNRGVGNAIVAGVGKVEELRAELQLVSFKWHPDVLG